MSIYGTNLAFSTAAVSADLMSNGSLPTNLSGGLKARGHPVGGTGLFQIAENYLQLTERFPNPRAQVHHAKTAISQSVGGPGNNNYVTIDGQVYYIGGDGLLLPSKKGQPAPDLRYFKPTRKP